MGANRFQHANMDNPENKKRPSPYGLFTRSDRINLKKTPQISEWVFPSRKSASGHIMDHRRTLSRILKRAGISNLHLHDLRRTLASWMAINGTSLYIIADVPGHSSTRCTQIYARLNNSVRRQCLCEAVDKMLSFQD